VGIDVHVEGGVQQMIVLIPAYEPDDRMVTLIGQLLSHSPAMQIVVVDDGSGDSYRSMFDSAESLGAMVLRGETNRGKGHALKEGFAYIAEAFPGKSFVCADCDGQHTYLAISRVGQELERHVNALVLGTRSFSGQVPARSRIGNNATKVLFGVATGLDLADTQTGLRGYPGAMIPWLLTIKGDRFEYELNVLLHTKDSGVNIVEIPIETIYLDGNASSHFRPIVDSIRVYAPLLRFALSSVVAFLVDVIVLFIAMAITSNLLVSVVVARVASSVTNYLTNRSLVFRQGTAAPLRTSAARYFSLVAVILCANYAVLHVLATVLGLNLLLAKLVTEVALFSVSFLAQRHWIFRSH
jgi:putative flippase GtrA